jgi:uncharacterized membrane protein YhaH (DUF805 family)
VGMTAHRYWLVVPASAVAAVIVWIVTVPLGGVDLDAKTGGQVQHVGLAAVIAVSIVVAVLAIGVRLALARARRTRPDHGGRAWVILATVVLLISFAGPAGAVSASAGWSLAAIHAVVGVVLILGLRTAGSRTAVTAGSRTEVAAAKG